MQRSAVPFLAATIAVTALLPAQAPAEAAVKAPASQFQKQKEVVLGAPGSFDYLTVDDASRRLLIAHGTKIDVIDLDKAEKVGSLEGLTGAHGALIAPGGRGFATSGRTNQLVVFDPSSLETKKTIATGQGPDAILWVATAKEVWVMNHRAGTVTCVDPESLEVKATIEVGGTLEFAVEWPAEGQVFVNDEDNAKIAVIDAKKHALVTKYDIAPAQGPTGLAIDVQHGILFSGCAEKLVVVDAKTGKVLATPAISRGCDAVAFDGERMLVFASCGDGKTTVVRDVDGKTFEVAETIATGPGGRTCTLDPKTHVLWVATGERGKNDVRVLGFASSGASTPAK
jgi:YVTN family beta-propeller protein